MLENGMHLCCQVASERGALAGCVPLIPPSCVLVCSQPAFYGHVLHSYQSSHTTLALCTCPERRAFGEAEDVETAGPLSSGHKALGCWFFSCPEVCWYLWHLLGVASHPYSWITLDVIEAACGFSLGISCVPQLCKVLVVFS